KAVVTAVRVFVKGEPRSCRIRNIGLLEKLSPHAVIRPTPPGRRSCQVIRPSKQSVHRVASQASGPTLTPLCRTDKDVRRTLVNADRSRRVICKDSVLNPRLVRHALSIDASRTPSHDIVDPVVELLSLNRRNR